MLAEVKALEQAVGARQVDREAVRRRRPDGEPRASSGRGRLGVRLAGRQVLDRVGFPSRPGEFTGLIGSNGAGKTTLFRVILGPAGARAGAAC